MSDREKQLLALMTRDASIMARRELGHAYLIEDDAEDKIARSKKVSELKRLARVRQARITAGLTVRRAKHPSGTMTAGERPDSLRASDGRCVVCGGAIDRHRSRTCSPKCARAVRAAKKAIGRQPLTISNSLRIDASLLQRRAAVRRAGPGSTRVAPGPGKATQRAS